MQSEHGRTLGTVSLYRIAGIFRGGGGVNFSWILGFVVIRGKKIVVGSGLNHTTRACL